jgi:putative oxidoreductase
MDLSSWAPRALSVLRIIAALLFIEHGTVKLLGFPFPGPATLPPMLLAAALIEIVGGVLVTLGLFTRIAAIIMSGEMAFAYFMVHAPKGFFPIAPAGNGGELAIVYCFLFLYIACAGPGPWSVDAKRR